MLICDNFMNEASGEHSRDSQSVLWVATNARIQLETCSEQVTGFAQEGKRV